VPVTDHGARRCQHDVAGQGELESAGNGVAVQRGDEDDGALLHSERQVADGLEEGSWRLTAAGAGQ
jgi:hypothetical protein